jgi:hypothetical protein
LRQIRWQKLQRYKSTKFGVLGLVDHTHSTRAELLDNAVMRNDLPDHGKQNLKLEGTGKSMKGKELTPKRMDGYGPHPAGKMAARDQWIGGNQEQRARPPHFIVNKSLGPGATLWVHIRGLASTSWRTSAADRLGGTCCRSSKLDPSRTNFRERWHAP